LRPPINWDLSKTLLLSLDGQREIKEWIETLQIYFAAPEEFSFEVTTLEQDKPDGGPALKVLQEIMSTELGNSVSFDTVIKNIDGKACRFWTAYISFPEKSDSD
jgi:O6-methylguanine-DNA--protein-cysteine methyltransferase